MIHSDNAYHESFLNQSRLRVITFSLVAICILAVSIIFFAMSVGKPFMGVTLFFKNQEWVVQSVDANGLAAEAGITVGDKPIIINNQSAGTFLEKYKTTGTVYGQLINDLIVTDGNNVLKSVTIVNASLSWRTTTELITWFFVCVVSWITGFFVFFKRPKSNTALLLCLCGLFFGLALNANLAGERGIPMAAQFAIPAAIISPWLLLHFFLILPEERIQLRRSPLVYLIYVPATITLILFPFIGYANGQPLPEFRIIRLFGYGIGFIATIGIAIFNYLNSISPKTKQQMKIILISCLLAFVPLLLFNLLPGLLLSQPIIPFGFSILFIVFIPLGMGYAVITQRLMDIDIIIRRGLVYTSITVIIGSILSIGILVTLIFWRDLSILEDIILALLLGSIATILFGPIKKKIELLIDKTLYKDKYDYRQVIQSLSSALASVSTIPEISRLVVGTPVSTLNLVGGCLFVKTQSDSLEITASQGILINQNKQDHLITLIGQKNKLLEFPNLVTAIDSDIAFIIRLLTGEKEIGVLCLSPKATRQRFSSDDLLLIQGLSSVSSVSLHSSMLTRDVNIRDTFVSIASHELRTPLTAIVGYADLLLRKDPPDATRRKWLKTILDNSQRITAMADDLLNVSRIQSGKIALKMEQLKLSEILDEQLYMARESNNIHEFVADIEPYLPNVTVDRDKFGQVVANLLSNAIKYSPNGGHIILSSHFDRFQKCVVVSVSDEGIGISLEDKKSLFTTFHRIQRPETQGIRGSGLGLFIAKEWTEAMGGKIWVESELNKGSTFYLTIPLQINSL